MKRALLLASAAAATLFAATAAEASGVHWSIGINVPPVATYVSSGPAWAPVRYAPSVVYAAPAPVYAPAPIVYDEPYVEPYVESYVVPSVGFYGGPVVVGPRHRDWAPPHRSYWVPGPRGHGDGRWDRHDRWHR